MKPLTYITTRRADSIARDYGRKRATLTITATTKDGYFKVTGALASPGHAGRPFAWGQIPLLGVFPELAPLIDLHLADLAGKPMHAFPNALYWVSGALPEARFPYPPHQGPEECRQQLAAHLRTTYDEVAGMLGGAFFLMEETQAEGGEVLPVLRAYVECYVEQQEPRWLAQAQAGLALLETLTNKTLQA